MPSARMIEAFVAMMETPPPAVTVEPEISADTVFVITLTAPAAPTAVFPDAPTPRAMVLISELSEAEIDTLPPVCTVLPSI